MDWTPDGLSDDVEDRRDDSGGGGFSFDGGGGLGIVGFLVLLVISLVTGRNFVGAYLSGGGAAPTQTRSEPIPGRGRVDSTLAEDRSAQLVSFVLNDVQKTWPAILAEQNVRYRRAKLVLFRGRTYSGCGTAQAATGPFYCPADEKVYIDLGFWDELWRLGEALPTLRKPTLSDINAGLKAAAAVGDDHIQTRTRGTIRSESFTHGTSAQRVSWFRRGLEDGTVASCDTFDSTK